MPTLRGAHGAVGEIVVRADTPWAINHGYYKEPEATARAWRNGWFHTGDAGRVDGDGNLYFVDRLKDTIRRRGENISSLEVETEVAAHPAVREAAVVPVPSELGEDEVMAVVALQPGHELDPAALLEFLEPRLAHFMIPRYVRVVDALPKTPTEKIEKHRLRAEGITVDSWGSRGGGCAHQARAVGGFAVRAPVHEALPERAYDGARTAETARAATATRRAWCCWIISILASACSSPSAHWGWQRRAVPPLGARRARCALRRLWCPHGASAPHVAQRERGWHHRARRASPGAAVGAADPLHPRLLFHQAEARSRLDAAHPQGRAPEPQDRISDRGVRADRWPRARAAAANGIALDNTTQENLRALEISAGSDQT